MTKGTPTELKCSLVKGEKKKKERKTTAQNSTASGRVRNNECHKAENSRELSHTHLEIIISWTYWDAFLLRGDLGLYALGFGALKSNKNSPLENPDTLDKGYI